jgi:predicted dehydrogenase
MKEHVGIGILGAGQIGLVHLEEYARIPEARVVAVFDPVPERIEATTRRFGTVRGFTNLAELLAWEEIDAVDVCVHNNKHAPLAIAALKAGKNVYCEKPIAGSYCDGEAMVRAARECRRMLHIQIGSLYSVETRAAKRLIEEGRLGRVYYVRSFGHRRRGRPFVDGYGNASFVDRGIGAGGALLDMGIYHLAQILYLLGNPAPRTITGAVHQELEMYEDRRRSANYSVEEMGLGWVRLDGGITLDLEESWAAHHDGEESGKLLGSLGGLRLNPFRFFSSLGDMPGLTTFDINSSDARWHACLPDTQWIDSSQRHWVGALLGRVPLLPTAELALNTALISEGIYLSSQVGREVTAEEVRRRSVSTAIDPETPDRKGGKP